VRNLRLKKLVHWGSFLLLAYLALPSQAIAQALEPSEVLFCETSSNLSIRDGVANPQANIKFAITLRGDIVRINLDSQLINWLEGREFWEGEDFLECLVNKDRVRTQKCPLGAKSTTELSVYRPDMTLGNVPSKAGFTFSLNAGNKSLFMKLHGDTGNLTMVNAKQMPWESLIKTAYANCVGAEKF
jgi:hypothetical protein